MNRAMRRSRFGRRLSARGQPVSCAAHSSTTLRLTRFGYFGSTASVCRSQLRTVLRDKPVRLVQNRDHKLFREPALLHDFLSPLEAILSSFNWSENRPAGHNLERDSVIEMASIGANKQPLAA
ncbi:hypothetical protein [Caballeronia sp. LZ001]|uniref:hypothetical protein n=1 Tax=Caballeronia sp. LZ001 TaxID=3038553 RepID=UPI0028569756|nr:hypothetical protein [Caballeronia sp. LZ001]